MAHRYPIEQVDILAALLQDDRKLTILCSITERTVRFQQNTDRIPSYQAQDTSEHYARHTHVGSSQPHISRHEGVRHALFKQDPDRLKMDTVSPVSPGITSSPTIPLQGEPSRGHWVDDATERLSTPGTGACSSRPGLLPFGSPEEAPPIPTVQLAVNQYGPSKLSDFP